MASYRKTLGSYTPTIGLYTVAMAVCIQTIASYTASTTAYTAAMTVYTASMAVYMRILAIYTIAIGSYAANHRLLQIAVDEEHQHLAADHRAAQCHGAACGDDLTRTARQAAQQRPIQQVEAMELGQHRCQA